MTDRDPREGLRRALSRHPATARLVALPVALYLRAALATGRWRVEGQEALRAALAEGPVILAVWHEHMALGAAHWPAGHPVVAIHAASPVGQVGGQVLRAFGAIPRGLGRQGSGQAASRDVLRHLRRGISAGIAVDGPTGPARRVQDPALDWARISGAPIWGYAFATRSDRRLGTWDRMLLPRLFDRGAARFAPMELDLPRRPDAAARVAQRESLAAQLDALSRRVRDDLS